MMVLNLLRRQNSEERLRPWHPHPEFRNSTREASEPFEWPPLHWQQNSTPRGAGFKMF